MLVQSEKIEDGILLGCKCHQEAVTKTTNACRFSSTSEPFMKPKFRKKIFSINIVLRVAFISSITRQLCSFLWSNLRNYVFKLKVR